MALSGQQIIHLPAGVPIDQSTRAEHIQAGQANLYAQNVRTTSLGALTKRLGMRAIPATRMALSDRTTGLRVASYKDTLVASDGFIMDVCAESLSYEWVPRGRLPECDAKRSNVASFGAEGIGKANEIDVAFVQTGYYVIVSREDVTSNPSTGVNSQFIIAHVVDFNTKKVVFSWNMTGPGTGVTDYIDPRVVACGNDVIVVLRFQSTLFGYRMNTLDPFSGFAGPVTLATNYSGDGYDLHSLSSTVAAFAYVNTTAGTSRITIKRLDSTTDSLTTLTSQTETTQNNQVACVALAGTAGEELWTTWSHFSFPDVYVSARDTGTLASIIAGTSVMTMEANAPTVLSIGRTDAHEAYVAAAGHYTGLSDWFYSQSRRVTNSSGSLVQDRRIPRINGWLPVARPFRSGERVYMELGYDDTENGTVSTSGRIYNVVLCDITGDAETEDLNQTVRPVGWAAPRLNVYYQSQTVGRRPARHSANRVEGNNVSVHVVRSTATNSAIALTEYDFLSATRQLPMSFAESLYWSGGVLSKFDGQGIYEDGFVVPPRITVTSASTGLTGTFIYTAIDEFTDATGNVIWGSPAPVFTLTISNKKPTVSVRSSNVTWKEGHDNTRALYPLGLRRKKTRIYRTTNGGGVFYLLATFVTDTATGVVTYDDTTADSDLISAAKLYTSPGLVGTAKPRQAMGAVRHMCECAGTLVAIGDDGFTLRAFAQRVMGEAPWHHDVLQLPVEEGGELTALASLDGSIIAFKRDSLFVIPVEPSNDNVTAGGFGEPRRLAIDVGCIDPRSVVVTSYGVFFQSNRGIELLTRSLTIEPIGNKIQDTFALYPNVVAATLDVRNGLVRFSLAQTGDASVGIQAVYDLRQGFWSSFDTRADSLAVVASTYSTWSRGSGPRFITIDANGVVYAETDAGDSDAYLDDQVWVTAMWETAVIKMGLQVDQQFWQGDLLLNRQSAAGLRAELAYSWTDYDSANDKVWNESAITSYPRQVELRPIPHSQGFKVRFRDTAPVTIDTGRGLEFIGLSLDVAPKAGPTQTTPRLAEGSRR